MDDLKSVGCWRKRHVLMLMPPSVRTEQQVSAWKSRCRDELRGKERLLLSAGDTWWDTVSEFTRRGKETMSSVADASKFWVGAADKDQAVVSLKLPRAA